MNADDIIKELNDSINKEELRTKVHKSLEHENDVRLKNIMSNIVGL